MAKRHRTRTAAMVAAAGAIGALASHFWDPDRGHARRARFRDQRASTLRRLRRQGSRRVRYSEGRLHGVIHRAAPIRHRAPADDVTLVQKIRSEVLGAAPFRDYGVSVDAHDGVVHLRGEIDDQATISALVAAVKRVPGVGDVDSYLHLRGVTPPNKSAALRATQHQEERAQSRARDDILDEVGRESFPASDPPSWTMNGRD